MKKRITSLLLATTLLLGLGGCASKASASEPVRQTVNASMQPAKPDAGANQPASQPDASTPEPAPDISDFDRARLWDATLDAVVADFAAAQAQTVMGGAENVVFSPVSVYLTLGTITDGAEGDTYAQLMDVLGASAPGDAIPYREVDDFFWNVDNYNGFSTSSFWGGEEDDDDGEDWTPALSVADSVWLAEGRAFRESFTANAQNNWYANVYEDVPFGTPGGDEAFNNWVTDATGGRVQLDYQTNAETALLAASAAYLRDGWLDPFEEYMTRAGTFTKADGAAVDASYMNQTLPNHGLHQADAYTQTVMFLSGGAEMHFVLPAEGTTTADLLADPAVVSAMLRQQYDKYATINFALPQFSFTSSPPVMDGIKAMGATDAFDMQLADFTGMQPKDAPDDGLYLSDLVHQAYIGVNENGVEAAAVTVAEIAPTSAMDENLEVRLDRPFIFFIRHQGMPLFMGVVNDPAAAPAAEA